MVILQQQSIVIECMSLYSSLSAKVKEPLFSFFFFPF